MTARISPLDPTVATGKAKTLLDAVKAKLGLTPNLMRTMAVGPAVLDGYLQFSGALAAGALNAKVREQVALAVAQANSCDYCLSAHSAIGQMVGLAASDISAARSGVATDPKANAAVRLARRLVEQRGLVADGDLNEARADGLTDGDILEVVANVALNILTNYLNHVARTEIDFPVVQARAA